jgi:hypothetical protein
MPPAVGPMKRIANERSVVPARSIGGEFGCPSPARCGRVERPLKSRVLDSWPRNQAGIRIARVAT